MTTALKYLMIPKVSGGSRRNPNRPEVIRAVVTVEWLPRESN